MKRTYVLLAFLLLGLSIWAQIIPGHIIYNSYHGLLMAGYQGWHNAEGDGANRGWYHYSSGNGFRPGSTNVDLWPDISEYERTYPTPFHFADGTVARVQSAYDSTTVDTHFRWMKEYGIDGVFMQRFVTEIRTPSGLHHFNHVLHSSMVAANHYDRAICIMYDLSGMHRGECQLVINDLQRLSKEYSLFDHAKNPSYLYHNGRPLISIWGIGFNDRREYDYAQVDSLVMACKDMGFSLMLGVPTYWRELTADCLPSPHLHELIRKSDIVMPWFVGRYWDLKTYKAFIPLIKKNMAWAKENGVDYAPLCFPGFSWHNMQYPKVPEVSAPRCKGRFFKKQLDTCLKLGAQMLYVAMFDEIDEGTAIYKISGRVPVGQPGSIFVPLEDGVSNDHYLRLAGQAAKKLKKPHPLTPPQRGGE